MARHDPLLPNAGIVARREYRDRVRSRLFVASTIVLMALALGVALAPIAIRYLDRQTVTRIARRRRGRPSSRRAIARRRQPPQHPAGRRGRRRLEEAVRDRASRWTAAARCRARSGELGGVMIVDATAERSDRRHVPRPTGRRTACEPARRLRRDRARDPRLDRDPAPGRAARAVPDAALPHGVDQRRRPSGGAPIDPQQASPAAASSGSCSSSCCS